VTRRLSDADVEVIDDNELITIKEDNEQTNIYLKEDLSDSQQPMVNFALIEYFEYLYDMDIENNNLFNLLMSAPVSSLPDIIAKHDIHILDEQDDESIDSSDSASEDDGTLMDPSEEQDSETEEGQLDDSEAEETGLPDTADEWSTEEGEAEERASNSSSLRGAPSLRDLIPSHQSRVHNVIERASKYQMSNALISEASLTTSARQQESRLGMSFPLRTRKPRSASPNPVTNPANNGHQSEEESDEMPISASSAALRSRNPHRVTRSAWQRDASPRVYGRSVPRRANSPLSVKEIRYREIGFLGELFVSCFAILLGC
jgi:hypothetical protein